MYNVHVYYMYVINTYVLNVNKNKGKKRKEILKREKLQKCTYNIHINIHK